MLVNNTRPEADPQQQECIYSGSHYGDRPEDARTTRKFEKRWLRTRSNWCLGAYGDCLIMELVNGVAAGGKITSVVSSGVFPTAMTYRGMVSQHGVQLTDQGNLLISELAQAFMAFAKDLGILGNSL